MDGQSLYGIAFILALGWLVLTYLLIDRLSRSRANARRDFDPPRTRSDSSRTNDVTDVAQQLKIVMAALFQRRRLLNHSEYKAFKIIEAEITKANRGYRVFAQTSLGEVLASSDKDAFSSINSKRVDMLIMDEAGWPALAIEYQGEGHYQGTAAARDAVKKEALRKAGIRCLEISDLDDAEQIRSRMRRQLGWRTAM